MHDSAGMQHGTESDAMSDMKMPSPDAGTSAMGGMKMGGRDAGASDMGTGGMQRPPARTKKTSAEEFTCPMHPEVRSPSPGKCPRCGMKLEPVAPPKATK